MTKLIATSQVYYAGKTRRTGEVFDALDRHARLLLLARRAKAHEDISDADTEAVRVRRKYRRRDMRAES